MAAVFLIVAGEKAIFNKIILKNKISVFIGKISYALYLWHWPILCYAKIYWGEIPSLFILIFILIASILLAYCTTVLIENPIRFGYLKNIFKVKILTSLMILLGIFSFFSIIFLQSMEKNKGWFDDQPAFFSNTINWRYRGNRNAAHNIVIFGDSHMHHFGRQLSEKLGDDFALDDITLGACYVAKSGVWLQEVSSEKTCKDIRNKLLEKKTPDIVITANYWSSYSNFPKNEKDFKKGILDKAALFDPAPKLMIFIGDPGEIDFLCESRNARRLKRKEKECPIADSKEYMDFIHWSQNQEFPEFIKFIYPFLDLCDEKKGKCNALNEKGEMNFVDNHHLSFAGGEKTAQKIAEIIKKEFPKN